MRTQRRFLIGGLVLLLAFVMILSACSQKDKGTNDRTADQGTAAPATGESAGIPENKVSISLFMYGDPQDGFDPNDNPIINRVEELTNVDLNVEMVSQADYETKYKLMLASGNLPDISYQMSSQEQTFEAARAGAFIDLKAYYDKSPIIQKYITSEMMELSKDQVTGNYWHIPMAFDKAPQGSGVIARFDLVEKYNNGVWPESVEQWVDLFRKVKQDNPTKSVFTNRNLGDMLFSYGGNPIFSMYGATPYDWRIVDGKIIPNVLLPEYKAAVQVMRQLYEEGILDKEFATVTSDEYWAKIEKDMILLDFNETAGMMWNSVWAANEIKDGRKYLFAPDLKNPPKELADMKYTHGFRSEPIAAAGLYISSNSKDPDRAWKVIEAFTSDEIVDKLFWGEEGKTYKVTDGKRIPDLAALAAEFTRYTHYYAFVPGFQGAPDLDRAKTEIALGPEYTEQFFDSIDQRVEYANDNGFGKLYGFVLPDDAALKKSESMQRINQFTVKAIMGEISMDQFSLEVEKWEKEFKSLMYDAMQKYLDDNKEALRARGVKQVDW